MKQAQKRKANDDFTSIASPLPHLHSQAVHASQVVYSHLIVICVGTLEGIFGIWDSVFWYLVFCNWY